MTSITPSDADKMAGELRALKLEDSFPDLHHFSQPQFESNKPDLNRFCRYCARKDIFREVSDNVQTIRRANAFIEAIRRGVNHDTALSQAWEGFPVVGR